MATRFLNWCIARTAEPTSRAHELPLYHQPDPRPITRWTITPIDEAQQYQQNPYPAARRALTPIDEGHEYSTKCPKVDDGVWTASRTFLMARRKEKSNYSSLDKATVIVDRQAEAVYQIPIKWLVTTSWKFFNFYANQLPHEIEPYNIMRLAEIRCSVFHDFYRWMIHEDGTVEPWCICASYATESAALRLCNAVQFGIYIDCAEYQLAAMKEFLGVAKFLEWPEDFVNEVWIATETWEYGEAFKEIDLDVRAEMVHPMRRMIVAVVAAKTVGKGKRVVRTGPRDGGIDRGDQIAVDEFWGMYYEYVKTHGRGEYGCKLQEQVESFL